MMPLAPCARMSAVATVPAGRVLPRPAPRASRISTPSAAYGLRGSGFGIALPCRKQSKPSPIIIAKADPSPESTGDAQPKEAAATAPPAAAPLEGVKVVPALCAVAVGLALRLLVPIPEGVAVEAWQLLSIFVATIVGLVLEPMPTGAWAFCALTVTVLTKTLPFAQAFQAFNNDVIWLIVVSFFFARGFEKTGLGERVANMFVKAMGKSTLGLAYGLAGAETLIAPAMPSTSARAGGIFMPIIASLSKTAGSDPEKGTQNKLGNYLVHSQMQTSTHSSVMFLTAAAQNLLCMKLAEDAGVKLANSWITWFLGAAVPSIIGVLITPLIVFKLSPPEVQDTPEAPQQAEKRLQEMGPVTFSQKIMVGTMGLLVTLWVLGDIVGISSVVTAMLGLSVLLLSGVLTWKDCLTYTAAWDTLSWFAVLVGMSGALNQLGIISYMAESVGCVLTSFSLPWPVLFGLLNLAYFLLHYMFASQTAHVGALYSAFIALMLQAGVPPVLAALSLGYMSNLFGAITHYSSGQAAVYYGSNYMRLPEVFRNGAIMSAITLAMWSTLGVAWWKVVGLM